MGFLQKMQKTMDFSNPFFFALAVFGGILAVLLVWIIRLECKWQKLFRGKKARTLEDALLEAQSNFLALSRAHALLEKKASSLDERMKKGISRVGTVRFNPFRGTSGSNQSFATALMDEEGNGVVLSSIHSREHVSVFAKPLAMHESEYELTGEERQAIEEARGK